MTESDDLELGVRRDAELDRGTFLEFLSAFNILISLGSFLLPFCLLGSVPLTIFIWTTARGDLKKIRSGRMDRAGEELTDEAQWRCLGTAILNALAILLWLCVLLKVPAA
jgi:hypothetical protein